MADWWTRAACRGMDRELFFPGAGREPTEALEVCARCPVAGPCLRDAMAAGRPYEVHGVWGGTTQKDRMDLKLTADGRIVRSGPDRSCKRCGGPVRASAARAQTLCDTCRGPRDCAECGQRFQPRNPEQATCSHRCAGRRMRRQTQERKGVSVVGRDDGIKHGTPAGYKQHIYRKVTPCEPCLDAINEQQRERRRSRPKADPVRELATPAERSA